MFSVFKENQGYLGNSSSIAIKAKQKKRDEYKKDVR